MNKIKILIVDDEHEFASTLAERLELRGFDTTVVNRGKDAFTAFQKTPFDVVLLDLKMPGMSGLEVLSKLKAHNSAVKVIMLTGHGSVTGISGQEVMKQGALDYIMKPVDITDVITKIREAIKNDGR